jgi:SAM-dependent methyltransferase
LEVLVPICQDLHDTDIEITDSPGAWYLGAKHTQATVCSLAINPSSLDLPSSSWGWPSNVESGLWDSCPSIPHPDNTFDVVLIHPIFHVLRCTDWPILIKEAVRVLIPGNCLAIQVMDPVPKRAGPLLEAWTTQYMALGLARKFMVSRPNLLVPCWIEEFASSSSETVVETTEFPIYAAFTSRDAAFEVYEPSSPRNTNRKVSQRRSLDTIDENPGAQGREEVRTYASLVGKHLYRSMYEEFAPLAASLTPDGGPHAPTSRCWWWDDPAILDECRRFDAAFEMVTHVYRKDDIW